MIQRMVTSALIAGFAAGLLAAFLHFAFVQNLILLAEQYETGELVHFQGVTGKDIQGGDPSRGTAPQALAPDALSATPTAPAAEAGQGHDRAAVDVAVDVDGSALRRNALTLLFAALVQVGFGLLLVAGYALAEACGKTVTARGGLLWGIAGFAVFQLAPAMGLAPELPGTMSAALEARQFWWWGTVLATGAGLAVLAYGPGLAALGLGVILVAAPHLIGAPEIEGFAGVAPPELAAEFAARILGVGLVVWAALGWLSGRLWAARPA